MTELIQGIARRTGLRPEAISAVVDMLDQGATVPFISRYRKEVTGSLDEVEVRAIESALKAVRELLARKEFVSKAIEAAGAMTPELATKLKEADSMTDIEDIYAPYKPKKRTRATIAREKGLEPLAKIIMSGKAADCQAAASRFVGKGDVATADEAIAGASDIIAEWASESTRLRNITRNSYRRDGSIVCTVAKGRDEELARSVYATYGDFSQSVRRIPSHQYLALRRAEREGLIKVKYTLRDDHHPLDQALCNAFVPAKAGDSSRRIIGAAVCDASKRLLRPSVENEISAELKEEADRVAIDIFSGNLRQLLLAAPLKGLRILAIDPGFRTGCKVVALDSQGNLLDDTVIYPVPPHNDFTGSLRIVERLVNRHRLEAVAIGNGTASHETERFVKRTTLFPDERIFIVSESGASVYSASDLAREEFPDKDVTVRGAVSIGRRLIDPLAELVKIDPKSIGVGQYQHDVDQGKLKDALDYTVMSCVNAVGVDINTASERLLSYISGIGPALASNIVSYRADNGDFTSRAELRKVPRLGDKAFEQSAGFLRVPGGKQPLDNTGIHPESYPVVERIAKSLGVEVACLPANTALLDSIDAEQLAHNGLGGLETIRDIITELKKPGRDPRIDGDNDAFVPGIEDFDDLRIDMELPGIVNNITAFGAFIDLGIKDNGLIHISKLSTKRVKSVSNVLKLGQRVQVKVIDIDHSRRRISLALLA